MSFVTSSSSPCPTTVSSSSDDFSLNESTIGNVETTKKAILVPSTDDSLRKCGERLRSGQLVSFPTETVYGLGCNALMADAALRVFEAKGRPLTDPLIVHVLDAETAMGLWASSSEVLRVLTTRFFPGPLTIVSRANSSVVPDVIMAGTGFVAVRSPSHPVARAIIGHSGVPIAAPSANRFGHVSPTRPEHVMHDLASEDVWVVDYFTEKTEKCCDVGVESTVVKVDEHSGEVSVLRQGAVSAHDLRECLSDAGLLSDDGGSFRVDVRIKTTSDHVANVAPGQTVRHYSPDVVSFLVSEQRWKREANAKTSEGLSSEEAKRVATAVVIDFGAKLSFMRSKALAYRDLSTVADSKEGAAMVFDCLRWAETVEGAETIYFPEIEESESTSPVPPDALTMAIKDRLTRAASGNVVGNFLR